MKIFISWSGESSHAVAEALREWLPNVIQGLEPWLSSSDIEKGSRWAVDIADNLNHSRVGIICLTAENMTAPWLLFEAGALSRTINQTFVCPYLFGIEPTDLSGPLVQFQSSKADQRDTLKLVKTINSAQDVNVLPPERIEAAFQKWWPDLETKLKAIVPTVGHSRPARTEHDMIVEILSIARSFQRTERASQARFSQLEKGFSEFLREFRSALRRRA